MEQARRLTGLSDFGDTTFLEPLAVLLRSYREDARLNPVGRRSSEAECIHLLANRLRIQHDLVCAPETLTTPVHPPIFITGLPRTGTTLTHRLLAQDTRNRALLGWELLYPSRTWQRGVTRSVAERLAAAKRYWHTINQLAPGLAKKHLYTAHRPEECNQLFQHSFVSRMFFIWAGVARYIEYVTNQVDKRPSFHHYRAQLQLLQTNRPGIEERWVLKSPAHLYDLELLFEVFPDARVIHCHRDPAEVLPSACSFMRSCRRTRSDHFEDREAVDYFLYRRAHLLQRAMEARGRLPSSRFYDVYYQDLVAEPYRTLGAMYEYFSLSPAEDFEQQATAWLAANPQHQGGKHHYSLNDHGLDRETVRAHFAHYYERFPRIEAGSHGTGHQV